MNFSSWSVQSAAINSVHSEYLRRATFDFVVENILMSNNRIDNSSETTRGLFRIGRAFVV
jgi:hypothetical protein